MVGILSIKLALLNNTDRSVSLHERYSSIYVHKPHSMIVFNQYIVIVLCCRLSSSDLDSASACSGSYQPVIAKDGKKDGKQSMSTGHKAKIRKALMKFNIMPSRNVNR